MEDEQVFGFIRSAVDLARESFPEELKPLKDDFRQLQKDMLKLQGDVSSELFSMKRRMDEGFKDLETNLGEKIQKHWETAKEDTAAVLDDIDKLNVSDKRLRKTVSALEKRVTVLEKAG